MTQRQLEATELTSESAGTRRLCPDKVIDSIVFKAKKIACFGISSQLFPSSIDLNRAISRSYNCEYPGVTVYWAIENPKRERTL